MREREFKRNYLTDQYRYDPFTSLPCQHQVSIDRVGTNPNQSPQLFIPLWPIDSEMKLVLLSALLFIARRERYHVLL